MNILIIIAACWGGFFLLALALACANTRVVANSETTKVDFQFNPLLFTQQGEEFQPLREIITSKLNSPTDRRARRLAGEEPATIFVVDDDLDILNMIKHVLELEGFNVRSFTNPEEALEAFNSSPVRPEMVVTDYCMEPMNGLELIARCREIQPDLKTVVISGMVDEAAMSRLHSRTDRFIHKPFRVANLVQTLNETLAKARN